MRTRLPRRLALASAAAVLAISSLGAATAVAGGGGYSDNDDFGTACTSSGSGRITLTSNFTIGSGEAGTYLIAWRTAAGSPISSKVRMYAEGSYSPTASTRLTGPYIFGIYNIATGAYDYVTCS